MKSPISNEPLEKFLGQAEEISSKVIKPCTFTLPLRGTPPPPLLLDPQIITCTRVCIGLRPEPIYNTLFLLMPTKKRRAACPTVPSLAPTLTFSNPDRRSHAPNTRLNSGRQPSSTPHVTHGGKSWRGGGGVLSMENGTGYPLKLHFQIPCVFPVFFLSNCKFSLCQFT